MNFKIFNKWDISAIEVQDIALKPYINVSPIIVPRTGGRSATNRLWAPKTSIVERLINKLMVTGHKGKEHKYSSGHHAGKAARLFKVVEKALEIIEKQTNKNPVEVLVKAIENAAPREEITTIEYGGARYPQAVEVSPQRRVDIALRQITQGAYQKSFNTKVKIEKSLSDEIIKAYNLDQSSVAIAKKLELERQADASR